MSSSGLVDANSAAEPTWRGLYRLGGVAALAIALVALLDVAAMGTGAGSISPATPSASKWFEPYHSNWFLGLRYLGFLNIINGVLAMPMLVALYLAHGSRNGGFALLALALYLAGTAAYLSCNAALPMAALSGHYASATGASRTAVLAAGQAILARGDDFTPGAFPGLFLSGSACLVVSMVMLRDRFCSRADRLSPPLRSRCAGVW